MPPQLITEVEAVRASLETAFDSTPPIRMSSAAEPAPPTWGEIWDVFVCGDLAHENKEKRKRFEAWRNHQASFAVVNAPNRFPILYADMNESNSALHFANSTTACASADRPSPTGPTFSAVLNFTDTWSTVNPNVTAKRERIAWR